MSPSERVVYHTCNVCEAMCGMAFTVSGGRIGAVRPDPEDVFSRGHICPKGPAMKEVLEDPDRLRHPVRRASSGAWEKISWPAAFDEAARRLRALQQAHGKNALAFYLGNPVVHNHGALMTVQGFSRALGTRNRFDANSQDANPKLFSCLLMFGDLLSVPIPDIDRTDYLLVLGANPAASNGSLMTLGDVLGRLRGVRERGGRIVLVDPRRSETASLCDEHHFIRPGGDAAFLLGLLHVLLVEEPASIDEAAVRVRVRAGSFDALRDLARRFPPERVAGPCGVPAEVQRRIARDFAAARRAVAYGRVGTCQNPFGPAASWLVDALNVVTGNFDREGGVMFPEPAVDLSMLARKLVGNHYDRWRSRVRGLPELGGQLPAAVMAEEMETAGPGQVRGLVTLAGNPVLSVPNGERLARALGGLEFMVAIDYYINETTRHAHLILPPLHALERSHYDVTFHALAVRNTAKYSEPVVAPAPAALDDWEILYELGMRLGGLRFGHPAVDRAARLLWRAGVRLHPDRIVDLLLRLGPRRLSLKKLRAAPHGIDLGPLTPQGAKKVRTPDGLVDLAPELLLGDVQRLDAWLAEPAPELCLIGRRHLRTNNSWMHNVHSLVKGPDRSALLMNPADAWRRGIVSGAMVQVKSRTGQVQARAELTEDIMAGVVSLPHGYGHQAARDTLTRAGALPGVNVNALTDDSLVEPLLGTAILNGVPVDVQPV